MDNIDFNEEQNEMHFDVEIEPHSHFVLCGTKCDDKWINFIANGLYCFYFDNKEDAISKSFESEFKFTTCFEYKKFVTGHFFNSESYSMNNIISRLKEELSNKDIFSDENNKLYISFFKESDDSQYVDFSIDNDIILIGVNVHEFDKDGN